LLFPFASIRVHFAVPIPKNLKDHDRKHPAKTFGVLLCAALALAGCARPTAKTAESVPATPANASQIIHYTYEVIAALPHDPGAFTQGLVFRDGIFLESTGLNGRSSLRAVEVASGRIVRQVAVPAEYFAEGLAVVGDKAFQLTWQNKKGFVYDADTFRLEKEFAYEGEGWGLATDGRLLILSDGTNRIRFVDPATFAVTRSIEVTADGKPVPRLNELEWIKGDIFANVWQTDEVVRIDPATGRVRGVINFSGLLAPNERGRETDVLNGIAYDAATDRLFVTGKLWPKIFQVRLKVAAAR
jgi:glutamine cyclotransferase